jgi:Do/DeqQ family serine protease
MTIIDERHLSISMRPLVALAALLLVFTLPITALSQPVGGIVGQQVPSLAPMIEQVSPAVVNISVSGRSGRDLLRELMDPSAPQGGARPPVQSAGSGVIVNAAEGYIITNHHVVENAERITVTLYDNRSLEARVVGSDAGSDIAVLKVDANGLTEISFGNSDVLRVGDYVVAIGNPFGFSHTVTSGIVSGLGRSGLNSEAYEDFIQTDASINPGNSGGALIDLNGQLVGINSAILSRTGGNIGIGFAIPVTMARNVMDQLIEHGEVRRGLLGISINPITPETASIYRLGDTAGALVTQIVPDSAAERAGLRVNDVIVSVNERTVRDPGALRAAIGLHHPGDRVTVVFIRDGERRTVTATLGEQQQQASAARPARGAPQRPQPPEGLGEVDPSFRGVELANHDTSRPGFTGTEGVLVVAVPQESEAWQRGLRRGDIITHVNRERIRSVSDARGVIEDARTILLQVRRDDREQIVQMR